MIPARRQFNLTIWALALGYFIFYIPYSFLIKILTTQLWPGVNSPVSGFQLLPAVVISTAVVLPVLVSVLGWWKHAGRRQVLGISIPFPGPIAFLSGLGTAIIIGTTTLAFSFSGISIVFALVLMRGGVLIIAPVVDRIFKRRVRWFSWTALAISIPALLIALADIDNYRMSTVATLTIAAYLSGYMLRLPCVTRLGKSADKVATYRYFVEEMMTAIFFLVAIPAVFALIGKGEIMLDLRQGFAGFFSSGVTIPAVLIGGLYACLYCFGTLIYLDCRENTFCVPLNRASSLLSGILAAFLLAALFGSKSPSPTQLSSAGMIIVALLFLSPLHHFDRTLAKLRNVWASLRLKYLDSGSPADLPVRVDGAFKLPPPRRVLFVCSGNTCRSPMAAAIGNAETAFGHAISAGVSARDGAPMATEAQQVLRELGIPVMPHHARNLTVELAEQVEKIFCMTQAHRNEVVRQIPAAAWKTECLDPKGDVEDPIGKGLAAYAACARCIRDLVIRRFDEIGLSQPVQT